MHGSNEKSNSQQRRFWMQDRLPTLAVIESVADFKETDPVDLAILAEHIDPDALNHLLTSTAEITIQFEYDGVRVLIIRGDEIHITDLSS